MNDQTALNSAPKPSCIASVKMTSGQTLTLNVRFSMLARLKILFGWHQRVIVSLVDDNTVNIMLDHLERS